MTPPTDEAEAMARTAVAQGWCMPENSHKEMDVVLAEAITQNVAALIRRLAETIAAGEDGIKSSGEWTRMQERIDGLERALRLVMHYPDVRTYLGSQVSTVADKALSGAP